MSLLGKTLGQYQLVEIISQGENTVYKAFQANMNRNVAVKTLSPSRSEDQAFGQQFQQDMTTLAALEHPNLLTVYDYGQEAGVLYLVTRYIEGGSLKNQLPQYANLQSAAEIIGPLAGALDYLHNRGKTHGNLKPSNILIDEAGQPLLTDFGFTQGLDTAGSEKAYLSPEQAQGGLIDRATDVYALGAVLYSMLIGAPPPIGSAPAPRTIRPNLPEAVAQIILKAMAPYPEQRFQTAGELSRALDVALMPQPKVATPPIQPVQTAPAYEPPPPPPQPQKKNDSRMIMIFGAIAIIALLIAAVCLFADGLGNIIGGGNDSGGGIIVVIPTPAPAVPAVTAQRDTDIFSGPGTEYDKIGTLRNGQTAEAIGQSEDDDWWAIKVLASPNGQGWVQANQVKAENTNNLPILPAPPLPEPTLEPPDAQPPTAVIDGTTQAVAGDEVSFSGRNSQVERGSQIVQYNWNLGDGTNAGGVDVIHVYASPGVYEVQLTVIDNNNLSSDAVHRIEIVGPVQLPSTNE